jgi:adenine C2-methylase RlmN of 23S rRNA A2503 and tRNA A37
MACFCVVVKCKVGEGANLIQSLLPPPHLSPFLPFPPLSQVPQQPQAKGQKDLSVFQDLDELGSLLGGTGKAKMVWESIREGKSPFENEDGVTAKARDLLNSESFLGFPAVTMESVSGDSTTKLLIDLHDGLQVESVVIPNIGRQSSSGPVEARTTLCVSSQVGCNRACDFCATGKMGFIRQLSTHEILSQVFHGLRVVQERGLPRINNIVFMGMGEPLNNPLNVMKAVEMLTDDRCFGFARSKVRNDAGIHRICMV